MDASGTAIEHTSDAVFGRDDGSVSILDGGKVHLNAVVQVTDDLQSVSTEVRSRPFEGGELRGHVKSGSL